MCRCADVVTGFQGQRRELMIRSRCGKLLQTDATSPVSSQIIPPSMEMKRWVTAPDCEEDEKLKREKQSLVLYLESVSSFILSLGIRRDVASPLLRRLIFQPTA